MILDQIYSSSDNNLLNRSLSMTTQVTQYERTIHIAVYFTGLNWLQNKFINVPYVTILHLLTLQVTDSVWEMLWQFVVSEKCFSLITVCRHHMTNFYFNFCFKFSFKPKLHLTAN